VKTQQLGALHINDDVNSIIIVIVVYLYQTHDP